MDSRVPLRFDGVLTPSLRKQCIGFIIGSALFALGSAPWIGKAMGPNWVNLSYFVGAWFFTAAALVQLVLSGKMTVPVSYSPGTMFRAEWLAGSTQFFGTLLFNVSTGGALVARSIRGQEHLVWNPDAAGSVAFLISGGFVLLAWVRHNPAWAPRSVDFWSGWINFVGCVAFGVSAVGGYITSTGITVDAVLANVGTFVGALCFLIASAICLPEANAAEQISKRERRLAQAARTNGADVPHTPVV